ncbi:hypothetical protein GCM10014715_74860 [Streptomyces spiralis]|uniref:Uncharacterized protein n=1 Tax=Streptomyces spiralis TaxID=66376 RepID=A0A919AI26_9ACTN|nr:hypothetical protein GCM10014715_74860 [Streptomyces spiralis]
MSIVLAHPMLEQGAFRIGALRRDVSDDLGLVAEQQQDSDGDVLGEPGVILSCGGSAFDAAAYCECGQG